MIRIMIYVLAQILLIWFVTAYTCQIMASDLHYKFPLLLLMVANNVALIILYLKDPGYLTVKYITF